ncbi:MAG: AbrB/MazE/SpoVT family DNA-binding domain-containing protein [Deltaproteobacteria bacterium]|nr:AbrB/MazE/SpoVT family DNA-binding domain-containing protein [Deltaproteobacteria bacterium]
MAKKKKITSCCEPGNNCKVESIVTVDERGQMVLPKELREKAKIKTGDKLAIASWQKGGEVCCITLIKAESLADMVKGRLGPVMKEIF